MIATLGALISLAARSRRMLCFLLSYRARRGDAGVSQRMRPDALDDPGPAGRPAYDPRSAVPVQPAPFSGQEDRTFKRFADG